MDNLTHTLFGLTLARTALGRAGRGTTAALVLSSNAPDIDIVASAQGAVSYLRWHRGPTHGPIGLVVLALTSAVLVWFGCLISSRWRRRPSTPAESIREPAAHDDGGTVLRPPSLVMLALVSAIGVLLHVLMDLPTSYGTRPFSPFDWHWYAVDWMPIVDVYLLIALAAGLIFGRLSPVARRYNAWVVLVLMAADYGLRGVAHHQALVLAPRLFGPTLPEICQPPAESGSMVDRWPRPATGAWAPSSSHRCLVEIAAIPTFLSPFRWRVLAQTSNAYEARDLDILDPRLRDPEANVSWRVRVRYPNQWTTSVERAATTNTGRVFLGFSRFPAARWTVDANGITTVRWQDMRFTGTRSGSGPPIPPPGLFSATVRLAPDGRVLEERLGN